MDMKCHMTLNDDWLSFLYFRSKTHEIRMLRHLQVPIFDVATDVATAFKLVLTMRANWIFFVLFGSLAL